MEFIGDATDLFIQFKSIFAPSLYKVTLIDIETYQPLEVITNLFNITADGDYITMQLLSFSTAMCQCGKFGLEVEADAFNVKKYYGWFKIGDCCDTVPVINVDDEIFDAPDELPEVACGNRIIVKCYDDRVHFHSYNTCNDDINGYNFQGDFRLISNIEGRIIELPRAITKEYTRNCKQLYAESTKTHLVEIFEYLPMWKVREVEAHLMHEFLYINGKRFYFEGGASTTLVEGYKKPLYITKFNVQECTDRQYFGCDRPCSTTSKTIYYPVPEDGEAIYGENRDRLGTDIDSLEGWLYGQPGVVNVNIEEDYIEVETTGVSPTYFVGGLSYENRVYPQPTAEEVEPQPEACAMPEVEIEDNPDVCDPAISTNSDGGTGLLVVAEMLKRTFVASSSEIVYSFSELISNYVELIVGDEGVIDPSNYEFDSPTGTLTFVPGILIDATTYTIYYFRRAENG